MPEELMKPTKPTKNSPPSKAACERDAAILSVQGARVVRNVLDVMTLAY
jgi:hypothetical protein